MAFSNCYDRPPSDSNLTIKNAILGPNRSPTMPEFQILILRQNKNEDEKPRVINSVKARVASSTVTSLGSPLEMIE
eukprot:scaffold33011_cov33-Attheya_sp.AAC.1